MPASAPGSARTCRGLAGKLRVPESPVRPEEACLPQPGVLAGAGALMPGSLSWLSQGSCSPGELTCQAGRRSWSRAGTEMGNGRGDTVRAGRGCAEKQWPPGPGVRSRCAGRGRLCWPLAAPGSGDDRLSVGASDFWVPGGQGGARAPLWPRHPSRNKLTSGQSPRGGVWSPPGVPPRIHYG